MWRKKTCVVRATSVWTMSRRHTKTMDLTKFEATVARFKARTLEIKAKRHKIVRIDEPPKPREAAANNTAKKGRVVPGAAFRCQAKTLEGKQCGFKAFTGGCFCKKHAIKT